MKKRIFQIIVFCALFYAINLAIGYLLERPHFRLIKKNKSVDYSMQEDFYAQPKKSIDMFFLGSSHSYRTFNPEIFDQALKIYSFNLGSPSQCPVTGYYVFKQALKTQQPKVVILEMFWLTFTGQDQFSNASLAYDFVRSPDVRYEFFQKGFGLQGKFVLLFPSYRFRNNVENCIRLTIGKDLLEVDDGINKPKGFVESTKIVTLKELNTKNRFDGVKFKAGDVDYKQIQYIKKLVELCRSKGIAIDFITSPLPSVTLNKIKNYKDIHDYINRLAENLHVSYIDGNTDLPKGLLSDIDFSDMDHLNKTGVKKFDDYIISRLRSMGVCNHPECG